MHKYIKEGVDVICMDAIVASGWEKVFLEAKEADIPIVWLSPWEASLNDKTLEPYYFKTDSYEEGRQAGHWLLDYLKKADRMEEEINIVNINGDEAWFDEKRRKGFREILSGSNNVKIEDDDTLALFEYGTEEEEEYLINHYFDNNKKVDVINLVSERSFTSVINMMEKFEYKVDDDLIIIGYSNSSWDTHYVKEKLVSCYIENKAQIGEELVELCIRLSKGEEVEQFTYAKPGTVMDINNVSEFEEGT